MEEKMMGKRHETQEKEMKKRYIAEQQDVKENSRFILPLHPIELVSAALTPKAAPQ